MAVIYLQFDVTSIMGGTRQSLNMEHPSFATQPLQRSDADVRGSCATKVSQSTAHGVDMLYESGGEHRDGRGHQEIPKNTIGNEAKKVTIGCLSFFFGVRIHFRL